jgi:transposase InsO family protein
MKPVSIRVLAKNCRIRETDMTAWLLEHEPERLEITDEVVADIRAFREEIGVGVAKTTVMLRKRRLALGLASPTERQMRQIFKTENFWASKGRPTPAKAEHLVDYVALYVGAIWHVDLKGPLDIDDAQGFLICFIDDRSRFVTHIEFIPKKTAVNTSRELRTAIDKWGPPVKLARDGGREFWADFEGLLRSMEIAIYTIDPYTPEQNGKIERFWRTLFELIRKRLGQSFNEPLTMDLIRAMTRTYNYERPHSAVGELTGDNEASPSVMWEDPDMRAPPGCEDPGGIFKSFDRDPSRS